MSTQASVSTLNMLKSLTMLRPFLNHLRPPGAAAPPWAAVPEVAHMTDSQLNKAKCDAAKSFGALAPIDVGIPDDRHKE